jgi:methionyl-tRNA formyltransferase (EC 2.1.2.9)
MKQKRIIFMGTASFSKIVLERLMQEGYSIVAVGTQPDRYVGRKKILHMPEVKEVALAHNIPVLQPQKIKQESQQIIDLQADIIITAAYGQIIPESILESAKIAAINVHASLLPKYRGGAPVHQAIIDGQDTTGVTIMYMVKKMDAGNIISQKEVPIAADDTTGILYEKLSYIGAELLIKTLPSIMEGTNCSVEQLEQDVTYAPIITREKEKLSFEKTVAEVHNQVRGLSPWPGAYVTYQGKVVKVWAGHIHACKHAKTHHQHQMPGTIVKIFNDAIAVKCLDGIYVITEFQLEGKRKMLVKEYLNGNSIFTVGTTFI